MRPDKKYLRRLIDRCIDGDTDSWNMLTKHINPLILSIIRRKLKRLGFDLPEADIENIGQEVLLAIWNGHKLSTLRDKDKAISWIYAFTVNFVSNYVRRSNHRETVPLLHSLKTPSLSPDEIIINNGLRDAIEDALESLNPKEKLIIKLSLLYDKKYREIAEILSLPIGTVLVSSMRAKGKLKRKLKKFEKNM